ncbi:GntR family transcriptional regulator [Nocardia cyriacigeorgica]|uniref:GntR family transcriptional regulator n=1 Tax=Nocardia cyriacigeorgica TaxID=135487 RepID=UPI001894EB9D|nr:winged helix-turn-helix domain-containing protein [Nocardia cyriacigeorgica]MBF6163003.1 winged helix-turn-helix transcriptional regulator [Nocardia cyriacigeorgica]MBF6201982.1 winged helix-turn-helix transcriptional regulator [Nocardia cyriacigeorgica]
MSKPRYAQIADDIRGKITRGDYVPGDQLPTKAQLMEQWSAALNTVARAITELQNEGLVETHHGIGSFVREPSPPDETDLDVADELGQLRQRVAQLEAMCARVEHLETLMMEVFSNLGLTYPDAAISTETSREAV